jgi:hypothetical protein
MTTVSYPVRRGGSYLKSISRRALALLLAEGGEYPAYRLLGKRLPVGCFALVGGHNPVSTRVLRIKYYGAPEGFVSQNEHGVAEAVEAVTLGDSFAVGPAD